MLQLITSLVFKAATTIIKARRKQTSKRKEPKEEINIEQNQKCLKRDWQRTRERKKMKEGKGREEEEEEEEEKEEG